MALRTPSASDYESYDGAHCFRLWRELPAEWLCPGCGRSKVQLLRWTTRYFKRGVGKCAPYKGWMAGLHRHHDHGAPFLSGRGRFPDTIVCDQCNAADGATKRSLGLPGTFSFSPGEIRRFVQAVPHGRHRINLQEARRVFEALAV